MACGLLFQWWSYKHVLLPRTPAAWAEEFSKLFILLTSKIRCNELQPRLESSLSTETHQAVFAQHASRYVSKVYLHWQLQARLSPPSNQTCSHPILLIPASRSWALWRGELREASKRVHVPMPSCRSTVQSTSRFPKFCSSQRKSLCLQWQLNLDRKQGT